MYYGEAGSYLSIWEWSCLGVLLLIVFPVFLISFVIFCKLLLRAPRRRGERFPCFPEDEEYMAMWEGAMQWRKLNADRCREVSVRSDNIPLCGEYYDFGGDRAVIVLPGRTECCVYSAYFAEPYKKAGCNVLLIDSRGTGRSGGWLNRLGFREWKDVLRWAELLHNELNNREVLLHGICIGCCTALRTCVQPQTPDWIVGMAAEGMFQCFYDTTKNHMIESHRPPYPTLSVLMMWIRLFCGSSAKHDGPVRDIYRMQRPLLMLHSREDVFSTPDKAQELFDRCPSKEKRIQWFDHGRHSRVRLVNTEEYDRAVISFVGFLDGGNDS